MGFSLKGSADIDSIEASNYTTRIVVGYPDDEGHWSGYTMAELGELLSTGSGKIPARPHLEEGIEANEPWIKQEVEAYFRQNKRRRDPSDIGEAMVEAVKAYVYSGALAPNAPYTVKKKGSDQPLVDTFELLSSLTYRVIKMGGSWRG